MMLSFPSSSMISSRWLFVWYTMLSAAFSVQKGDLFPYLFSRIAAFIVRPPSTPKVFTSQKRFSATP
jgi:hypothetical protein